MKIVWASLFGELFALAGLALLADGIIIDAPKVLLILAGAGSVIALLFKLLISSKDKELDSLKENMIARLDDAEDLIKIYKEVAAEATKSSLEMANFVRGKEGKSPLVMPLPVVAEGSSPPTTRQQEVATAASFRATMVVIKHAMRQEPRKEPNNDKKV